MEYYSKYGSKLYPAIVINNQTFRGQLEVEAVMNAICAGFADPPRMCKRVLDDNNTEDGVLIFDFDEDMVPMHHVAGVILFTMLTVTCVLCLYRRHAKRQMKTQINAQIEDAVN
jgi:cbb3-type cytochrome oxidase subunit 3